MKPLDSVRSVRSMRWTNAVTPVNETLIEDVFKEKKTPIWKKILLFFASQFSLRNIFVVLLAIGLITMSLAVWGLSYTGSTLSISFLMGKLRTSASNSVAASLNNLFQTAEGMTQEVVEYAWADKNQLRNLTDSDKTNWVHFMYSVLKPNFLVRELK
jgi:hypothetical protein